jgi:acetolactate synthase-1/2/3 large subunit
VEFPTDVLREKVPAGTILDECFERKPPRRLFPDPSGIAAAADALWSAKRPLVVTGRGAKGAGPEIVRLLDALGAAYLDTQESRGLVPPQHPSHAGAMRGRAMADADLVVLIGRKLDYRLGYGSPAALPHATFVRIADTASELFDNRRGIVELLASPALALAEIV